MPVPGRAEEPRGGNVLYRVQADVSCAGALSAAAPSEWDTSALCSLARVGCGRDAGGLFSLLALGFPLASEF